MNGHVCEFCFLVLNCSLFYSRAKCIVPLRTVAYTASPKLGDFVVQARMYNTVNSHYCPLLDIILSKHEWLVT